MSHTLFVDPFESVFNGTSNSTKWERGFEDAMAGKKPQSEERNYINGYETGKSYRG